nr:elicitin-like protein [Pythium porphyrae]
MRVIAGVVTVIAALAISPTAASSAATYPVCARKAEEPIINMGWNSFRCATVSWYSFYYPSKRPTEDQMEKMCDSDNCRELFFSALTPNPSECVINGGGRILLRQDLLDPVYKYCWSNIPIPSSPPPTSRPPTPKPTTPEPTTPEPTTPEPTTPEPTTPELTTPEPTTPCPYTPKPDTPEPTTPAPTTPKPITPEPTTPEPTTPEPTTPEPTTPEPTTPEPTTPKPTVPSGVGCGNMHTGPLHCLEGQYCQPWNPWYYQCRPVAAKCGKPAVGVDFYGDDIVSVSVLLPELCCAKCQATAGCKAFTFVNYNYDGKPRCYLKKGTGHKRALPGAVSAVLSSSPAPCAVSGGPCGTYKDGTTCCPPGEYCQPWNPFYYQCRPVAAKCAVPEVGIDYYGDDIQSLQGLMPWACCDACATTAGCKAYTFVNSNPNSKSACYLKRGTGTKRAVAGAVSSTVLAPLPSKCAFTLNVVFYGTDLFAVYGLTPEQCCDKCASTARCKAFTHVNEPGRSACYLKTSSAGKKPLHGVVSGSVN